MSGVASQCAARAHFSATVSNADHLALLEAMVRGASIWLPPAPVHAWINWPEVAAVVWQRNDAGELIGARATMLTGVVVEFGPTQAEALMTAQPTTASAMKNATLSPFSSTARTEETMYSLSTWWRTTLAAVTSMCRSGVRKMRKVFIGADDASRAQEGQR